MLTLWLERRVHVASSLNTTVDAQEQSDARQPPSLSDLLNNPTRRRRDRQRSAIETCWLKLRGLNVALDDMLFYIAHDDMTLMRGLIGARDDVLFDGALAGGRCANFMVRLTAC